MSLRFYPLLSFSFSFFCVELFRYILFNRFSIDLYWSYALYHQQNLLLETNIIEGENRKLHPNCQLVNQLWYLHGMSALCGLCLQCLPVLVTVFNVVWLYVKRLHSPSFFLVSVQRWWGNCSCYCSWVGALET